VNRLRALVADDHQAMLDKLVLLLSYELDVVAVVRDGAAAVNEAARLDPDVLVLDIAMPVLSGIAAAGELKAHGSTARVVFVTTHRDRAFVESAVAQGIIGFVAKDRLFSDLMPAIRSVVAGESFVSPLDPGVCIRARAPTGSSSVLSSPRP
jgi:DNA-binding NarL/FixJ family response regulator